MSQHQLLIMVFCVCCRERGNLGRCSNRILVSIYYFCKERFPVHCRNRCSFPRCTCRYYGPSDDTWAVDHFDDCGRYGYDCQDPVAPTDCDFETDSPTPSPTVNADYPYCTGSISSIPNGYCNYDNSNAECEYDGGDCCPCTCIDGVYYTLILYRPGS